MQDYSYQLLRSQGFIALDTELTMFASEIGAERMNSLCLPSSFHGLKSVSAEETGALGKIVRDRARDTKLPASDRELIGAALLEFLEKRVRALRHMHYSRHSSKVTNGVRVEVVSVQLAHFAGSGKAHFAYRVKVTNLAESKRTVTLVERTWNIRDCYGRHERITRQPGVGGKQPVLKPGDSYEYASGAVVEAAPAVMRGKFHMITALGGMFDVTIAPFGLLPLETPPVTLATQELVSGVESESALLWVGQNTQEAEIVRELEAAVDRARVAEVGSSMASLLKAVNEPGSSSGVSVRRGSGVGVSGSGKGRQTHSSWQPRAATKAAVKQRPPLATILDDEDEEGELESLLQGMIRLPTH